MAWTAKAREAAAAARRAKVIGGYKEIFYRGIATRAKGSSSMKVIPPVSGSYQGRTKVSPAKLLLKIYRSNKQYMTPGKARTFAYEQAWHRMERLALRKK
jgi:hypothetical protein